MHKKIVSIFLALIMLFCNDFNDIVYAVDEKIDALILSNEIQKILDADLTANTDDETASEEEPKTQELADEFNEHFQAEEIDFKPTLKETKFKTPKKIYETPIANSVYKSDRFIIKFAYVSPQALINERPAYEKDMSSEDIIDEAKDGVETDDITAITKSNDVKSGMLAASGPIESYENYVSRSVNKIKMEMKSDILFSEKMSLSEEIVIETTEIMTADILLDKMVGEGMYIESIQSDYPLSVSSYDEEFDEGTLKPKPCQITRFTHMNTTI